MLHTRLILVLTSSQRAVHTLLKTRKEVDLTISDDSSCSSSHVLFICRASVNADNEYEILKILCLQCSFFQIGEFSVGHK